jgi:chemotaxis protein CheZ
MPPAASRPVGAAPGGRPAQTARPSGTLDTRGIIHELAAVADYIKRIKVEIGALRANEICRDRLPEAHRELGGVVSTTASATHAIMGAAEDILANGDEPLERYRERVEGRMLEILEACSFQDITGQRINRVLEDLAQVERRLNRFADAVNARDAEDARDPEEVIRQARRDALLLHGPQDVGVAIDQDEIDKLFG